MTKIQRSIRGVCLGLLVSGLMSPISSAFALTSFNPTDFSALTNDMTKSLVETIAIGADHRPYEPATPLGVVIGLDTSMDVTLIKLPSEFQAALRTAGVGSVPSILPLPRLNVHKGLPFGVDVGMSFIGYQGNQVIGGDIKWAFLPGGAATPAVAVRVSQNYARLFFLRAHTTKIDVLASKKLAWFLDPYIGTGVQFASGSLDAAINVTNGLSANVSGSHSMSAFHIYAGIPAQLGFVRLTAEYDYSFSGVHSFGTKFGFNF